MKKKSRVKICDELWAKVIKKRAGYQCERCHRTQLESKLDAHHIIGRQNYHLRYDLTNGICLCFDCHINFAHCDPEGWHLWLMNNRERDYDYLNREKDIIARNNYQEIEDKLRKYLK